MRADGRTVTSVATQVSQADLLSRRPKLELPTHLYYETFVNTKINDGVATQVSQAELLSLRPELILATLGNRLSNKNNTPNTMIDCTLAGKTTHI